jgi:hypothetical protein
MVSRDCSTGKARSPKRIGCSGTAFVADCGTEGLAEHGPPLDLPQFTIPGMDCSFFMKIFQILRARPMLSAILADGWETAVRRVGGTHNHRRCAIHLYECSDELSQMLAALTGPRVTDLARQWQSLIDGSTLQDEEPKHRTQHRAAILTQLTLLAKAVDCSNRKLMLRVVYRTPRQRS